MQRFIRMLAIGALVAAGGAAPAIAASSLPPLPAAASTFRSGSLRIQQYGNGPRALIFIPGLSCGPWSWAEQITHFSPAYTVYALTLDGFDGRAWHPRRDLFARFDRDFWQFIASRHLVKPVVVGHSLGGTLAIALAESHPKRLAGVIALDGLPVFPTLAMAGAAARAAAAEHLQRQVAGETPAQLLQYEAGFMKQIGTTQTQLVMPLARAAANSSPAAIGAWGAADLAHDGRPELAKAAVPLLELMPYAKPSPYSENATLRFYRMLLNGAPMATVEPIPNARHFAMIDQPAAVDAAITRFLAAH